MIVYRKENWFIDVYPSNVYPDKDKVKVIVKVYHSVFYHKHAPKFKTTLKDTGVWWKPWTWGNLGVETAVCEAKRWIDKQVDIEEEKAARITEVQKKIQEIDYSDLNCGEYK